MTERHLRRVFIARCARMAVGSAALAALGGGVQAAMAPSIANAHNVSGNKARASELYTAMQSNYYLGLTSAAASAERMCRV